MAKDTFYFTHDFNARQDAKIKRLIMKHGMAGYGMFWSIVEDLYNNANALPTDYESIAFDLRSTTEVVTSIIKDFGLFVVDGDTFGSMSVQSRLDARALKSKKARDSAHKRWDNDANALPTDSDSNAIKERKEKERKEKERKDERRVSLKDRIPTLQLFIAYGLEKAAANKLNVSQSSISMKYEAWKVAGWLNGNGDEIRNWKASLLNTLPHIVDKPNGKQPIDKNAPIVWDDQAIKDYIENPFISKETKDAFLIERRQERKQESNTLKLNA
jgi:hypothetical protein